MSVLLGDIQAAFSKLEQLLQATATTATTTSDYSSDDAVQDTLLEIKSLHRKLSKQVRERQDELDRKLAWQQRQQATKAALRYERQCLQVQIQKCHNFSTPHLLQIAQEEYGNTPTALQEWLGNHHPSDSQQQQQQPRPKRSGLQRLHRELNARGLLERDVKNQTLKNEHMVLKLNASTKFLESLPDQVAAVERASFPLQKLLLLQTHSSNKLIGSERKRRLEQAQQLPVPLYTLFQQVQQYIDVEGGGGGSGGDEITIHVLTEDGGAPELRLQLTVPDVVASSTTATTTMSRPKKVTIHFGWIERDNVIVAHASGASSVLQQDVLLQDLFPGDNPMPVDDQRRRPFHWCNYLGGIYHVQPLRINSTRVIVRELQRRIRANATLQHLLHSLQRQHLPLYEKDKTPVTASCKLAAFEATADSSSSACELETTYAVTLRNGSSSLNAQVQIHMARYPAVPPVWTLLDRSSDLYDDRLAALQRKVNEEMLDDESWNERDEEAMEWILVRQLQEVMLSWASWMDDGDEVSKKRKRS